MHAVVVRVTINDREAATQELRDDVVPAVSQAPGFVAGYWTRKEGSDQGLSMAVFESEDAANGMAERVRSIAPEAVNVDDVEVREVVASA
jgi:heme-degrading monooxygenase HmoA